MSVETEGFDPKDDSPSDAQPYPLNSNNRSADTELICAFPTVMKD